MAGYKEKAFYSEAGEALKKIAEVCGSYPIPGGIPDEGGQGSGLPNLAVDISDHCMGVGLYDLKKSLPALRIL